MSYMVKLRAHHGMCLMFFEGKGYSDSFTQNMAAVLCAMQQAPLISIADDCDVICAECPNNIQGVCADKEKVDRYDRAVLDLCDLNVGNTLSYSEFYNCVLQKVILKNKRCTICGDCKWNSICLKKEQELAEKIVKMPY